MKGISPLIATVLLIAFTMAIAGMMATWATGFVQKQIASADNSSVATCAGSITVDARIVGGKGYAIVSVDTAAAPLTAWTGYLYYTDPSENKDATLSNSSIALGTGQVYTFTFNYTNTTGNPVTLKMASGSCAVATRSVPITFVS